MKTRVTPLPSTVSTPVATLGTSHGYRFNGDNVELTASFRILAPAAHERTWALQLRTVAAPSIVIATAALPPLGEVADEIETFTVRTVAHPPAGRGEHLLGLALVASDSDGRLLETHDFAAYPRPETFALPRFAGSAGCEPKEGFVTVRVTAIENPRDEANLSGTLSLELWALPGAYTGGPFKGTAIAGAILGRLAGQDRWTGLAFDLPVSFPAQSSHLVLMLREWNGAGYVTRDFVNLPGSDAMAGSRKAAPAGVDINSASIEELTRVKGLTKTLARGIVAGRPFRQWDELRKVKGIGPKVLAKIRGFLRLN